MGNKSSVGITYFVTIAKLEVVVIDWSVYTVAGLLLLSRSLSVGWRTADRVAKLGRTVEITALAVRRTVGRVAGTHFAGIAGAARRCAAGYVRGHQLVDWTSRINTVAYFV
jgi:hypothetical protein